ncbi:MAG: tryptophan 2,3-dioxygenase [Planctomycetes bacterium]|nr:tryptophan 2,3-dioxygenase [Planctomycetota bacterium]
MSFGQPKDGVRYGSYLRVPELLKTQAPLTNEHDELQFIIIHQVYELWFRLVLHELDAVMVLLSEGGGRVCDENIREAARLMRRVICIQGVLLHQIAVMETMRPVDFLRFREYLKPASGFQSAQFREVEFLAGNKSQALLDHCDADDESKRRLQKRFEGPTLRERYLQCATSRGFASNLADPGTELFTKTVFSLVELYRNPPADASMMDLSEAFMDFDEGLGLWRSRHFWMVERVIGGKIGTGYAATGEGFEGIRYLSQTLNKKAFPELWEVRTRLTL